MLIKLFYLKRLISKYQKIVPTLKQAPANFYLLRTCKNSWSKIGKATLKFELQLRRLKDNLSKNFLNYR